MNMMEYKGFKIEGDGTFGNQEIKPMSRGSVPIPLRGVWVTKRDAQRAIDNEVAKKEV